MTTTISVNETTKERFDDLRPEGAASADEFLGVLLDHYDDGEDETNPKSEVSVDAVEHLQFEAIESIHDQLDRIEASAETAEERGMVDDSEMAREVAAQIDYVELAGKVADELEGRMR